MSPQAAAPKRVIFWIRGKAMRLHDNPALQAALELKPEHIIPLFCLDPHYVFRARVGIRRWQFLLETMTDMDKNLSSKGSQLIVARGDPLHLLPKLFEAWKITHLVYEQDTEPYSVARDRKVEQIARESDVEVISKLGHTLYDPEHVYRRNGNKVALTYNGFLKVISKLPQPTRVLPTPESIPPVLPELQRKQNKNGNKRAREQQVEDGGGGGSTIRGGTVYKHLESTSRDPVDEKARQELFVKISGPNKNFDVPTLHELGFKPEETLPEGEQSPHRGGETEALRRLEEYMKDKETVAKFEKPKTSPAAFEPASTTVLSPYLKFGCLSCRLFLSEIHKITDHTKSCSQPPVSLLGQLYWRDFYYSAGAKTPNYDRMVGNPICLQVPWRCKKGVVDDEDEQATELLKAWSEAKTGYPWIDAIMTQLRKEGWIHHLARHSVACFLTRGQLYVSWERGAEVFEELLLDADWSLNVGNWLWLSASAFFHSYFRVYSPVTFGQKYDKQGKYIRKYIPALKDMPDKYIYEPWKAPKEVQKKANCIIGKDYPMRVVDADEARKQNMGKMKLAYSQKLRGNPDDVESDPDGPLREIEGDVAYHVDDDIEEKGEGEEDDTMQEDNNSDGGDEEGDKRDSKRKRREEA